MFFSTTWTTKFLCWWSIFNWLWSELFTGNTSEYIESNGKSKWWTVCLIIDQCNLSDKDFFSYCRNNPRFPCPCTLDQAVVDNRFSRLSSETSYESSQNIICYAPMSTSWIRSGWTWKQLRTQVWNKFCFFSIEQTDYMWNIFVDMLLYFK